MKDKIKLEEVSGYFAHNLEIKITNHERDYVGLKNGIVKGYHFYADILHLSYIGGSAGKSQDEMKLILRPLSALTKEIEVDGKQFVPIIELAEWLLNEEPDNFDNLLSAKIWLSNIFFHDADNLPYKLIKKLYEWHLDIHNLIKRGLAIEK